MKVPNLLKVPNRVIIRLLTVGSQPGHHGHLAIVPDRLCLRHAAAATGVQQHREVVGFGAPRGREAGSSPAGRRCETRHRRCACSRRRIRPARAPSRTLRRAPRPRCCSARDHRAASSSLQHHLFRPPGPPSVRRAPSREATRRVRQATRGRPQRARAAHHRVGGVGCDDVGGVGRGLQGELAGRGTALRELLGRLDPEAAQRCVQPVGHPCSLTAGDVGTYPHWVYTEPELSVSAGKTAGGQRNTGEYRCRRLLTGAPGPEKWCPALSKNTTKALRKLRRDRHRSTTPKSPHTANICTPCGQGAIFPSALSTGRQQCETATVATVFVNNLGGGNSRPRATRRT